MPIREDILVPIPGENPSGVDLRYDTAVYDKIKEARRQDVNLTQGAWQSERKTANWPLVIKLAQETLATNSKDLQIGAYLTEALLQTERFAGLRQGLDLINSLADRISGIRFTRSSTGSETASSAPSPSPGSTCSSTSPSAPPRGQQRGILLASTTRTRASSATKTRSRPTRTARPAATMIEDGKIAPEIFDKAFTETPKAFYLQAEKDLDACLATVATLENFCDEKFEDDAPGFGKLEDHAHRRAADRPPACSRRSAKRSRIRWK